MTHFEIGDTVRAINKFPFKGNTVAPPLEMYQTYTIQTICYDKAGNQHLDVGLSSQYNYITSYETKEALPNGDVVHWCHPSRFDLL